MNRIRWLLFVAIAFLHFGCDNRILEVGTKGNVLAEYYWDADGKKHGHYITYYENGNKRSEGEYEHDIQVGEWKNWHEQNGAILSVGSYDARGKENGKWLFYYPNGSLQQSMSFKNGVTEGRFIDYWETGIIKRTGSYLDGLTHGWDTTFFEDGQTESISMWRNGKLHGRSTFYTRSGRIVLTELRDDAGPVGYIWMHDTISGDTLKKYFIRWGELSDTVIEYRNNLPFDIIVEKLPE